ncbi:hypothetical protein [Acidovorax radicis]|uniref:hypothetical protein n=1 Tax=Acidovorax radicis TaxID=758826 RepID=UPI001CFC0323|nr:hypothetical protein [Acidovorax radicis]UCV00281.1 hypothetical protein KI609_05705 [Acidovorax radicis]
MLTREEQETVLRQAKALARRHVDMRRRLERSEVSPRRAKELIEQAEADLKEMLKEIG